ncbi:MAG: alpha-ketoacid dehydrogenase subunit beta [Spirochaetia bacterium]
MKELAYRDAIREAIYEEMNRDERVFIAGEDVGRYGGAYAVTRNLIKEFGERRVVDTPISEAGMTGLGVGAAIAGLRPIIELMYVDFIGLAMDQIGNQMAKFAYMSGGRLTIPMVLRTQGGTGRSAGSQHSQSLETYLVHTPGLRVVMPSTSEDAKGLLKTAIRSDDPVVFIEHKALYAKKGPVPEEEYTIPFGRAKTVREGKDVSIITYSRMVHTGCEAAAELSGHGIDAEVIDLRTLNPLDTEAVIRSVRKTRRAVVLTEAHRTAGMSAEISSLIHETCYDVLVAPVVRIAGEDVPVPATYLEKLAVPSAEDVVEGARKLVEKK